MNDGVLYLADGAYFNVQKGTLEQLKIFLDALRSYGCTNVPREPTGEMLTSKYIVYTVGGWSRKPRMVYGKDAGRAMKYEVVPPDPEPKLKPAQMSSLARIRGAIAMLQAELKDLEERQ